MRFSICVLSVLCISYLISASEYSTSNDAETNNIPYLKIPLLQDLPSEDFLSFAYYQQTCPEAEAIIHNKVKQWFQKDFTIAASILRLHFHDCAVRGCDASILLNYEGSERRANASKTLRGFDLIDEIKAEIEIICPRTVSCADILTASARDATVLVGGPYWSVPFGRKDGKFSYAKEAEMTPMGREDVTTLIEFYQSRGLSVLDLVVLSGAHTIGKATCGSIQWRIYNHNKANGVLNNDPIDDKYLDYLTRKCRWASDYVDLDGTTPSKFDAEYFRNLEKKMGLLLTDQILYSDPRTAPIVTTLANAPSIFDHQFAASMVKLGNIQVLTGEDDGEIRTNCNFVNSGGY